MGFFNNLFQTNKAHPPQKSSLPPRQDHDPSPKTRILEKSAQYDKQQDQKNSEIPDNSWIQDIPTPDNPSDLLMRIKDISYKDHFDKDIALVCHDISILLLHYTMDELPEFIYYKVNDSIEEQEIPSLTLLEQFSNYLLTMPPLYKPLPKEIYILAKKKPLYNTSLSAKHHFPWISESEKENCLLKTLLEEQKDLTETDYEEGYTRESDQEAIRKEFIEIANKSLITIFDNYPENKTIPSKDKKSHLLEERMKSFFKKLITDGWMPTFFEMYRRYYKKQPRIEKIVKDPGLFDFWVKVLKQEDGLKISALNHSPLQRERLKNQSKTDQRHPFDILIGNHYGFLANKRTCIITKYLLARVKIAGANLLGAKADIEEGIERYHAKTKKDKEAKQILQKQIDTLNEITVFNDWQNHPKLQDIFSVTETTMNRIMDYQVQSLMAGKEFGDFNCFLYTIYDDINRLDLAAPEGWLYKTDIDFSSKKIMTQDAEDIINGLLEKINEILSHHPYISYLLATKIYRTIARAYEKVVRFLINKVPQNSTLRKNAYLCRTQDSLTEKEMNHKIAIDFYKTQVRDYYALALTMIYIAEQLQLTQNYEAIVENTKPSHLEKVLLNINGTIYPLYPSLSEFHKDLKIYIKDKWETLCKFSNNRIPTICQTLTPPTALKDQANRMIEDLISDGTKEECLTHTITNAN